MNYTTDFIKKNFLVSRSGYSLRSLGDYSLITDNELLLKLQHSLYLFSPKTREDCVISIIAIRMNEIHKKYCS